MDCLSVCHSQTLSIICQMLWKCIPIGYVEIGRFLLAAIQCHLSLQLTLAAISLLAVGCKERDNCASQLVIMLSAFCLKMISLPCNHAVLQLEGQVQASFSLNWWYTCGVTLFLSGKNFHCVFLCGWGVIRGFDSGLGMGPWTTSVKIFVTSSPPPSK